MFHATPSPGQERCITKAMVQRIVNNINGFVFQYKLLSVFVSMVALFDLSLGLKPVRTQLIEYFLPPVEYATVPSEIETTIRIPKPEAVLPRVPKVPSVVKPVVATVVAPKETFARTPAKGISKRIHHTVLKPAPKANSPVVPIKEETVSSVLPAPKDLSRTDFAEPARVRVSSKNLPPGVKVKQLEFLTRVVSPGEKISFNFKGTGFDVPFLQMLRISTSNDGVALKDLTLLSPTEASGTLTVTADAANGVFYPVLAVLGTPVFQSKEPYVVLKSGKVLSATVIDSSKKNAGKIRIVTNISDDMLKRLSVFQVCDGKETKLKLSAKLPNIVEAPLRPETIKRPYYFYVTIDSHVIWKLPSQS